MKMETKQRKPKISEFKAKNIHIREALRLVEKEIKKAEKTFNEGI